MLLALDIGNTNIKTGLFENGELLQSWRITSDRGCTADEYGIKMEAFFQHIKHSPEEVDGIIMSSVIPALDYTIEHMCSLYFGQTPLKVSADLNTGLKMCYEMPSRLGGDRICNAVAGANLYGGPCIVVDFGTATTFSVVSGEMEFLGGIICPGFIVSSDALVDRTQKLPRVSFVKPDRVIGNNTERCIQSGILYGYVGQVEYLVNRVKQELGTPATVVGTGGMSGLIHSETDCIDYVNPTLTLQGLHILYELNK